MKRVILRTFMLIVIVIPLLLAGSLWSASTQTETTTTSCININSATVEQLQTLPCIGPAIAQRIVRYREKVGPFNSVEDIKNVKGIGERRFERIKGMICVK